MEQRDTVHTQDELTGTLLLLLLRLLSHQEAVHGVVRILGGVQQHFAVSLTGQLDRHDDEKTCDLRGGRSREASRGLQQLPTVVS